LKNLENEIFDILIIGGGSAGAGVLLDAYCRGFKCALIEGQDFASGTSSKSSKLSFGGLQSFQQAFELNRKITLKQRYAKLKEVKNSIIEREFILNSASFMNKLNEFKIIATNPFDLFLFYYGIFFYEVFYFLSTNFQKYKFSFPKLDLLINSPRKKTLKRLMSIFSKNES